MKRLILAIFLFAFLLIRPYSLQSQGLMYMGDDYDYFAHASSMVFGQFPSYEKEFHYRESTPLGSVGPGLMAAPFVLGFSAIDHISGADIVNQRTQANIPHSWSQFGFIFASNFYFIIGCFLLFEGLKLYTTEAKAAWVVILMVLIQGLPLFVFRRPVFSHAFEFFLQSALVYMLLKRLSSKNFARVSTGQVLLVSLLIALVTLVRYNNIVSALVWPFVLFVNDKSSFKTKSFWQNIIMCLLFAVALVGLIKFLPDAINGHAGYLKSGTVASFFKFESISFYFKRLFHIFFALDWGLVFSAPFVVIGLVYMFIKRNFINKRLMICLAPLLVNLYGIIMYGTQGGWYGYRYLLASIVPVLVYPGVLFVEYLHKRFDKKAVWIACVIAIFPLISMLAFEGNNSNLTLRLIEHDLGGVDWDNKTYQLEVWKTLVGQPKDFVIAVLKGGPLYVIYLAAYILGKAGSLPSVVLEKYASFNATVVVKMIVLYALPFLLYPIWKARYSKRGSENRL